VELRVQPSLWKVLPGSRGVIGVKGWRRRQLFARIEEGCSNVNCGGEEERHGREPWARKG